MVVFLWQKVLAEICCQELPKGEYSWQQFTGVLLLGRQCKCINKNEHFFKHLTNSAQFLLGANHCGQLSCWEWFDGQASSREATAASGRFTGSFWKHLLFCPNMRCDFSEIKAPTYPFWQQKLWAHSGVSMCLCWSPRASLGWGAEHSAKSDPQARKPCNGRKVRTSKGWFSPLYNP